MGVTGPQQLRVEIVGKRFEDNLQNILDDVNPSNGIPTGKGRKVLAIQKDGSGNYIVTFDTT